MEKENSLEINHFSKSEDLRLYILEHTILIEEIVSSALGQILNIDWKNSKSFGFSSSALSFNQKVQIIQDIQGLEKIEVQKLSDIMSIRNKFAHVRSIATFNDFFLSGENGKNVKKNLDKWYGKNGTIESESEEQKYKRYFFILAAEVITTIILKAMFYSVSEQSKLKEIDQSKIKLESFTKELEKLPGDKFILKFTYEKILKEAIEKITAYNSRLAQ
ncbi:hypothetical protein [Flavobacterium wongokense]|uniref:hypothetical protein n=1 Tax=Flavobacterium wongokense TaxID=2910674 RepID=UPI001F1C7EEF|nr:hypothetical protein [Flavobacterium sp. WG47]MCF6133547.1 hypothetical protein [Flavobacterium sp. WG47]